MMMQKILTITFLFLTILIFLTSAAFHKGDRISTHIQSSHGDWETTWIEFGIHQMPRFLTKGSAIIQVVLPSPNEKGALTKLDINHDLKISLTFLGNKLIIPWIKLFDSKTRKSMTKLNIIFETDEFDVLRLKTEVIYGNPIQRLDPGHPTLTTFEINYSWKPVGEENLGLGISLMFAATLLGIVLLGWQAIMIDDAENTSGGTLRRRKMPVQSRISSKGK